MTNQHPLHPKLIDALSEYKTCPEAMQAAADWQLKKVIAFLRKNLDDRYIDDGDALAPGIDAGSVIDDLKQAMRPQENN